MIAKGPKNCDSISGINQEEKILDFIDRTDKLLLTKKTSVPTPTSDLPRFFSNSKFNKQSSLSPQNEENEPRIEEMFERNNAKPRRKS